MSCFLAAWILIGASATLGRGCTRPTRRQLAAAGVRHMRIHCDRPRSAFLTAADPRGARFDAKPADSYCSQDAGRSWLRRGCQHRVGRKPGKLSGAACRMPFASHPRDAGEFRRPTRPRQVRPRSPACDSRRRSHTRDPAARKRRLDADPAGRLRASSESPLSRGHPEALGRGHDGSVAHSASATMTAGIVAHQTALSAPNGLPRTAS